MNVTRIYRFAAGLMVAVAAVAAGSTNGAEQSNPVAFLMLGSALVGVAKLCFRDSDETRNPGA